MASHLFNEFKRASAAAEIDLDTGGNDIRLILCMTNTTADTENAGITTISGLGTLDEFDGANYSRQQLTNETVNKDDANNRAEFDADDVTISSLGVGTRNIAGALIYKHVTNDTDSIPIAWIEFSATPDGSDFTIQWDAQGILQLS